MFAIDNPNVISTFLANSVSTFLASANTLLIVQENHSKIQMIVLFWKSLLFWKYFG